jgi:RNA-directed DNA polymerase
MKRVKIEIEDVASFSNLADAATKAARGKRGRREVIRFFENFQENINGLREKIVNGDVPCGDAKAFKIFDPKERLIHAPCFEDRALHHGIINFVGPVLDRAMVDSAFACRVGKGVHAAARQVQKNIRRFPWHVKIDIESYFDSIHHHLLLDTLKKRIKGDGITALIEKIISGCGAGTGKGLPIGALPSQHFANYYLDSLDRLIMEGLGAKAHVRYMDDILWWQESREKAKSNLARVKWHVENRLLLKIKKTSIQINKSSRGVSYCGFRILPGKIKLSIRKQRRYQSIRKKWETAYESGLIDGEKLQAAWASVYGITTEADSRSWRKEQLRRRPAPDC